MKSISFSKSYYEPKKKKVFKPLVPVSSFFFKKGFPLLFGFHTLIHWCSVCRFNIKGQSREQSCARVDHFTGFHLPVCSLAACTEAAANMVCLGNQTFPNLLVGNSNFRNSETTTTETYVLL